jgi:Na+-transporting NADH:ubiquinone oxidoreductase subunit A
MSKTISIRKGYDIKMKGIAAESVAELETPSVFAVKPTDFKDLTPKLALKAGAEVKAGEPLFFDKDRPSIQYTSPVSGEVSEVRRGAKRKILEVVVLADKEIKYKDFGKANPASMDANQIKERILEACCWTFITQRPYGCVANPDVVPKAVFVSGFNSVPLAANISFALNGKEADFATGLEAVSKMAGTMVHLGLSATQSSNKAMEDADAEKTTYKGAHPAGNVGVQIHHTAPVNKGEVVWTITPQDLVVIGRLFNEGKFDARRTIAVAGSEINNPEYVNTMIGASLEGLFSKYVSGDNARLISGNVYTGEQVEKNGFLGFYADTVTANPEGNQTDFMGWVLPGFGKFSVSRTFSAFMSPNKEYDLNTGMHGEERAFVVSGEYEKYFPFDIYPQFLLRAILTRNIDKMEELGVYEIVEEDFALPEVVCTSKIPLQHIVKEGLSFLKKEMGH